MAPAMFNRILHRPQAPPAAHTTNSAANANVPAPLEDGNGTDIQPMVTREKRSRFSEGSSLEAGTAGGLATRTSDNDEGGGWRDPYGPAPGFVEWWRLFWHDVLAFVFLGAIALWLLMWSPLPYNKYFTVTASPTQSSSGRAEVVDAVFSHPKLKQFVPIIADAMIAVFTPIISIVLINIFGIAVHSSRTSPALGRRARYGTLLFGRGCFWNTNAGCLGVIYAVMTGAVLQIITKIAVPGLRPHFLTVCDPQLPLPPGEGYGGLYYTARICRDHTTAKRRAEITNAMQSFPSGHSVAAWAGLTYLAIYFNAHLKPLAGHHASWWKGLVCLTPLLAAVLIVGSLTLDMSHHWYDILAGSALGVGVGTGAYRMCFASITDWRFNHVPLLRTRRGTTPFSGGTGHEGFGYTPAEMAAWAGCVATRRGGWGTATGVQYGAPGDVCSSRMHSDDNKDGGIRIPSEAHGYAGFMSRDSGVAHTSSPIMMEDQQTAHRGNGGTMHGAGADNVI